MKQETYDLLKEAAYLLGSVRVDESEVDGREDYNSCRELSSKINAYLKTKFVKYSSDDIFGLETEDKDEIIKIGGVSFRCACSCNVFRALKRNNSIYKCNSCGEIYKST